MPKNDGKKGEGSLVKVNPYTVEVNEALTALQLLESQENETVFLSICTLDSYISKFGKIGLSYLQENDFLGKLFNNLDKAKMTRTMCLKILLKLIQLENIIPKIRLNLDYTKTLITIFMTTDDPLEIEYTTYLLCPICEVVSCAELLCQDNIINKLFEIIVTQMDVDVKNNCLELIVRLVNCHEMRKMLSETPSFRVKVLHLVLQGPFFVLRPITVEILTIISKWEFDSMQAQLFESETISYMFDVLCEEKWTNVQINALSTIYNCLKSHPIQVKCMESKNFLTFVNFARNSDLEHALACVTLIKALVIETENRQVLCDLRVHEILPSFCKFDDDTIYMTFCNTIAEFCKNCHLIKELATPVVLKEIERLMSKTNLTWVPHKQAGLQPLYLFLVNNPHLRTQFYQTNILKHILDALMHRDNLETLYYKMTLEMFQTMLEYRCLHKYMWSPGIYFKILSLLNDCNTEFIKLAMDIIQRTFYSQEYREWFLKFHGVEYIATMLSKSNCDYLGQAVAFCKCATKHEDLCTALLKNGLVPVIKNLGADHQKPICDTIIEDIYKCDLSIKFHDTWFLDYQDVTKNGFCIYVGYKPSCFPSHEVDEFQKLSFTSTMITVNFHGKQHGLPPTEVAHEKNKQTTESAHSEVGSVSEDKTEVNAEIKIEVKVEVNPESKEEENLIFKHNLPVSDKDLSTDNCLKTYLKVAQRIINKEENDTVYKKIVVLAKFVKAQLSGYKGTLPTKHRYETHILELKKKLSSNYIPLGYIRVGGMIERALLFKVLADRLGIPATFRRTSNFCAWNEVSVYNNSPNCFTNNLQYNFLQHYVVDLMEDPGTLLPVGHKNTEYYYKKSQKYSPLPEEHDSTSSSSELTSSYNDL